MRRKRIGSRFAKCGLSCASVFLAITPPAGAGELLWQSRASLATNASLSLAFNNTRAVIRSRDGQRVYAGWKQGDGLWMAVVTNAVVQSTVQISSNPMHGGLTLEESPAGQVIAAYAVPGGVGVRESTNNGAAFGSQTTISASGPQSSPSLSFSDAGEGYLVWHSSTTPTVLYGSALTNGAATWTTPVVLETNLDNPQFASVWARSGSPPLVVWRADANPTAGLNWNIRFLAWTNGSLPVTLPTTIGFDPSVFRAAQGTLASYFDLGQKINVVTRTNGATDFSAPFTLANYGRFPHLLGNARGVVAVFYEYTDAPAAVTNDSVKKIGLQLSFDGGVTFTNSPPPDLASATNIVAPTGWVSDGWLDLMWLDRSVSPTVLRYQPAAIVYPPEISDITRSGLNLLITFFGSAGKFYSLEYTPALGAPMWTSLSNATAGIGGEQSLTVHLAPATPQRFFRLVQQ